jgi:two-component system, OmpR family, response regulator RegX3
MRIALVEDDNSQSILIKDLLESRSHQVHVFDRGRPFLAKLAHESFDLLVLDWILPDISGLEVLLTIRKQLATRTAVVFLTNRDAESDIVQALEAGADDFVVKPAREREFLARIDAVLRRATDRTEEQLIVLGPYKLEAEARRISVYGKAVELTQREFDVALFFFRNPGKVLSRGHLMEAIWGRSSDATARTVDTHVSRLRTALRLSAETGVRMIPVYGYGYRLDIDALSET